MTIHFNYAAPTGHDIDIEWYHDGVLVVDGTFDGVTVSGATTTTLTITNPTSEWNGSYFARVIDHTDDCEVDSEPVIVTVPPSCELAITVQPVNVDTSAGNTVELSVAYTGEVGTVTFQWYKDGVALEDGAQAIGTVSGALTATLTIDSATVDAEGSYTVILVDDGIADCSVESEAATVTVAEDCDLLITEQPESQEVLAGGTLELTFAYTSSGGPFTIQWYLDDVPLVDGASGGSTISGATTETLTITDWTAALAGAYYAIVTDTATEGCVAQTATAIVTELVPPANMFIWYKADGETRFSDGQVVDAPLQDFSGNNLDLTIKGAGGLLFPLYETNELNGLPVFDIPGPVGSGNDDFAFQCATYSLTDLGFPIASTGFTLAIVIKRTTANALFDSNTHFGIDGLATVRARIFSAGSGGGTTITYTGSGHSTTAAVTVPVDEWQIITLTFDFVEGIPRIRSNDTEVVGAVGVGTPNINTVTFQLCAEGQYAEALGYNVKLSDSALDQLRAYLSAKYDIPITV